MFKVGDRIRTNRTAAIRYGVIHQIDPDGAVIGEFNDGQRFFRDPWMLHDLVLAGDEQDPPGHQPTAAPFLRPQPGERVMVTWPDGRRFGVVHPNGSYIGRRAVHAGTATVQVLPPRVEPLSDRTR